MLTSSQNVEDLEGPDHSEHTQMYNAGVKMRLRAKSNNLQVYTNLKWMTSINNPIK
jgi:hypothetical protein